MIEESGLTMDDITKHYRHLAQVYFDNWDEPFEIELRKEDVDRFKRNMSLYAERKESSYFFRTNTVDGKEVAVNIASVQMIHFMWEPQGYPEDYKRFEGPLKFFLKNRKEPFEIEPEHYHEAWYLFMCLEESAFGDDDTMLEIADEDGEDMLINRDYLLYVEAPSEMISEGKKEYDDEDED